MGENSLIDRIRALHCPPEVKQKLMELIPMLKLQDLVALKERVVAYEQQWQRIQDGTFELTESQKQRLKEAKKKAESMVVAAAENAVTKKEEAEMAYLEKQFDKTFSVKLPI